MAFDRQRSLFDPSGGSPLLDAESWVERVLLGEIAIGLCVLAVAFIGALMLTGRLPLREGMRVVLGCFVLPALKQRSGSATINAAPVIAAGLMQGGRGLADAPPPVPPLAAASEAPRADLPPANYDPYAGASLGQE